MDNNIKLCVIANAENDEGKIIYLQKFINIIRPMYGIVYVITGDFPKTHEDHVQLITTKQINRVDGEAQRIYRFIRAQLVLSYSLAGISKHVNTVILFGPTSILPLFISKFLNKKIIIIMGGSSWKGSEKIYEDSRIAAFIYPRILRCIENLGLSLSNRIGVESESAVKFLCLSNHKNKISIISNMYLDLELFKMNTNPSERLNLVGFISRLNEGKGVLNFIYSIPLILRDCPDTEFLIGGTGELFAKIESLIHANDLSNKVRLVGWIPHKELPTYLNELKLLVLPSLSEGIPNIIPESMACGSIILSSPVGGIPDLVKSGETGFLLESTDPESIAKEVLRVLSQSNLDEIAANARTFIETNYTYESVRRQFSDLLNSVDILI